MKKTIIFLAMLACVSVASGQGYFCNEKSLKLSVSKVKRICRIINQNYEKNGNVSDLQITISFLESFHEFLDSGPYQDRGTVRVDKKGYKISYKSVQHRDGYCHFHKQNDDCCSSKDETEIFIPYDLSKCYHYHMMYWGVPTSVGGSAIIKSIEPWHKELIKAIKR